MDLSPLQNQTDWQELLRLSEKQPCLLLKHSPRCQMSQMAFWRLSEDWPLPEQEARLFYLDVLAQAKLSQQIASQLQEHHLSPQVLLIDKGDCVYEADGLEIDPDEIAAFVQAGDWW